MSKIFVFCFFSFSAQQKCDYFDGGRIFEARVGALRHSAEKSVRWRRGCAGQSRREEDVRQIRGFFRFLF